MERHIDVQELMESGIDLDSLKSRSYLIDENDGRRWKYSKSYLNPVGVEVFVLIDF